MTRSFLLKRILARRGDSLSIANDVLSQSTSPYRDEFAVKPVTVTFETLLCRQQALMAFFKNYVGHELSEFQGSQLAGQMWFIDRFIERVGDDLIAKEFHSRIHWWLYIWCRSETHPQLALDGLMRRLTVMTQLLSRVDSTGDWVTTMEELRAMHPSPTTDWDTPEFFRISDFRISGLLSQLCWVPPDVDGMEGYDFSVLSLSPRGYGQSIFISEGTTSAL